MDTSTIHKGRFLLMINHYSGPGYIDHSDKCWFPLLVKAFNPLRPRDVYMLVAWRLQAITWPKMTYHLWQAHKGNIPGSTHDIMEQ